MSEDLIKTSLDEQFVRYQFPDPSPLFTRQQIEYIESAHRFLTLSETEIVRKLERFVLNVNTGIAKCDVIPDLREDEAEFTLYVRRFASDDFLSMINRLLDRVIDEMIGRQIRRTVISPFRMRLNNGDKYYPVTLNRVIIALRPKLLASVAHFGAKTAKLDRGKFVLESGEIIPLSAVEIDRAERDYPEDW